MRYLGGKYKIRKQLATYIRPLLAGRLYVEPFLGSGAVAEELAIRGHEHMYLADAHPDLIAMYTAVRGGWMPPTNVSEELYQEMRDAETSALRGFVGFGCSFGGKFFGGYARGEGRNYAAESAKTVVRFVRSLSTSTEIHCQPFTTIQPTQQSVIYCDPPYAGTTEYKAAKLGGDFWEHVRRLTLDGHVVLVSEYSAPSDFTCVLEMRRSTNIRPTGGNEARIERLFAMGG